MQRLFLKLRIILIIKEYKQDIIGRETYNLQMLVQQLNKRNKLQRITCSLIKTDYTSMKLVDTVIKATLLVTSGSIK